MIIILLGLAVYAQTFGYGFVFDDNYFMINTPYIKSVEAMKHVWFFFPKTRLVGIYSLAFNYSIGKLNPQGYHIFNFIIHLLAVGLVWALSSLLFKIVGWVDRELPFIIALIFLVHPCQTQAVSYISQRFESMATLFYLGCIYTYIRARISTSSLHQKFLFLCSFLFALLGIFTKEVAVTIPLMILAVEFTILNKNPIKFNKFFFGNLYLIVISISVLFVILFLKIVHADFFNTFFHFSAASESHDNQIVTGGGYLLTQMRVFLTFLRLLILPIHQTLDYDYPLSLSIINPPLTLVGLCLIAFISFLIIKLRRDLPLISFGLAWILITFLINIAPRVNLIFEHKLYLISFGFILALVSFLSIITHNRKLLAGVLMMYIAILSIVSFERNHVWKNELTLWSDVIKKSPHKARAYDGLGVYYGIQGNFSKALQNFNTAIELNPKYAEAYCNRANVYTKEGIYTKAISDLSMAIDLRPNYPVAHTILGEIYKAQGDSNKAMAEYNKAIEIDFYNEDAHYNRGEIFEKQGNLSFALSDYNNVIENYPENALAYFSRGNIYDKKRGFAPIFV